MADGLTMKLKIRGANKVQRELKQTGKAAGSMGKGMSGAAGATGRLGSMMAAGGPLAIGAGIAVAGFGAVVVAAGALARAYAKAISETVELATQLDELGKKARSIGADPEQFQALIGAFELAGVESGKVMKSMQKLNQTMGEAMKKNPAKTYTDAFDALKVSAAELARLPLKERMLRISEGMAGLATHAERAQVAALLLGRSGRDMLVGFEGGREGLQGAIEDIERFGVASNKAVRASEDFKDAQLRAGKVLFGLKAQVLEPMIPVLAGITNGFADIVLAMPNEDKVRMARDLASVTGELAIQTMIWAQTLHQTAILMKPVVKLTGALVMLNTSFGMAAGPALELATDAMKDLPGITDRIWDAHQGWNERIEIMRKAIEKQQMIADIPESLLRPTPGAAPGGTPAAGVPAVLKTAQQAGAGAMLWGDAAGLEAEAAEAENELLRIGFAWLAHVEKIDAIGMAAQASAFARIDAEQQRRKESLEAMHVAAYNAIEAAAATDAEADARLLVLKRDYEDALTAIVRDGEDQRAALRDEAREQERVNAESEMLQTMQTAVKIIETASGFATMIGAVTAKAFGENSKEAKDAAIAAFVVAQAAAVAQATLSTALSVSAALAAGPPFPNIPMGVLAGVLGGVQIATILGTAIAGVADAGLPPGALRAAGLNNHTALAVRNDEMVLDPVGTRAISRMLERGGGGEPVVVNTVLEIDGNVLGQTVDSHLIRSSERGMPYAERTRYGGR
jgi:hypothetical protein